MIDDDEYNAREAKLCLVIPPNGKGRPYRIYSSDADESSPQFVPRLLRDFYNLNPESFKTRITENDRITQHGKEFFSTDKGVAFLERLEDFAKNGKEPPKLLSKP